MSKLMKIVLTGIVLSAAIIGIVVVMTPLTDEAIPHNEASPQSARVADKDLPRAQGQYPKLPTTTTLDLPKVRLVKETKALQEELREAARLMTEKFPQDSASWHLAAQVESELFAIRIG